MLLFWSLHCSVCEPYNICNLSFLMNSLVSIFEFIMLYGFYKTETLKMHRTQYPLNLWQKEEEGEVQPLFHFRGP